jgi:septal ring factor EnvC (AmiA/AmiB activator)
MCYAVDTWRGDEQAGFYGEEVFIDVNACNERRYARFSRLLRMTFDEALHEFSDESIDLLHIDGLHTYEAVRHDFEAWLPKLARGAVVMFHDTGVREGDFGVWRLWEELQAQYPHHIEFPHSNGLGVLQLNGAPGASRQQWLRLDRAETNRLTTYFAALGLRLVERFELKAELSASKHDVTARDAHIANLGRAVVQRDAQIADLTQHASNLDAMIADLRQHASNLDATIVDLRQHASNLDAIVADLRQHASNLAQELLTRDAHIGNLGRVVAERNRELADLRQIVSNLNTLTADLEYRESNLTQELSVREATIANLNQTLAERDDLIVNLGRDVHAIRHSTSWRLTAPLRWVAVGIRKARRQAFINVGPTSRHSE